MDRWLSRPEVVHLKTSSNLQTVTSENISTLKEDPEDKIKH
jgi:hypothetical protein